MGRQKWVKERKVGEDDKRWMKKKEWEEKIEQGNESRRKRAIVSGDGPLRRHLYSAVLQEIL